MHSKFSGYFTPSRSIQRQTPMYHSDNLTSEESDYYASNNGRNDASLRFIIIRHGERVDATYGAGWTQRAFTYNGQYYPFDANMPPVLPFRMNWLDFEIDTPLTANGLKQSLNVGNTLARHNLPVVACYASPAIRSIQTADQILAGMGRKGKNPAFFKSNLIDNLVASNYSAYIPIRVELGLFECSSWYALSPINFMSDQELVSSGFNIDTNYRSQMNNLRSTENEYEYYERSKETMKKLIKLHRRTSGTILIVAHAPSLEVLTRHLMNGHPRPEQLANIAGKVGYCSMTIVDGGPSSKTWQFRYSLDERANQQQLQIQQLNNMLTRSATVNYPAAAVSTNYMTPATTNQFQYFQ